MEHTDRWQLPYIAPSQAQKHVTHNEAVRMIDALVHATALTTDADTPPDSPDDGDCHIVGDTPTGAWAGHEFQIACFVDGGWDFITPAIGMRVWTPSAERLLVWNGAEWMQIVGTESQRFEKLGVHANPDSTNRLAVSSPASLFSHDGSDHRMAINKNLASNTASLLLQQQFSGRAELGLAGDDNFSLKVSPDGSVWKTALSIDRTTGEASLPATPSVAAPPLFNMLNDGGRFAGSPEPQSITAGAFVAPTFVSGYNGGVFSAGPKFTHNNSTHGGAAAAISAEVSALVQKMRPGTSSSLWRYGPEFHCARLVAGSGTVSPLTVGGTTYHVAVASAAYPLPRSLVLAFWILVESGGACLNVSAGNGLFVDGVQKTVPEALTPATGWVQAIRRLDPPASSFNGYDTNLAMLYATAGASLLIAAPVLFPGHLPIRTNAPYGLISSLTVWR